MSVQRIVDYVQNGFLFEDPPESEFRAPVPEWVQRSEGGDQLDDDDIVQSAEALTVPELPADVYTDKYGIDSLAFYLPFHFYKSKWGIYIRSSGLFYLATVLAENKSSVKRVNLQLAYDLLRSHETLHFFAERACTRAEISCFQKLYKSYFVLKGPAELEEALANAYADRKALRDAPGVVRDRMEAWMANQGPGYCDFQNYIDPKGFKGGRILAAWSMQDVKSIPPGTFPTRWPGETIFNVQMDSVPVYFVRDPELGSFKFVRQFPKFKGLLVSVHTNEHRPPHFHVEMPPGKLKTRYQYPFDQTLQVYPGDPPLSNSELKHLRAYLDAYGEKIEEKINRTFFIQN